MLHPALAIKSAGSINVDIVVIRRGGEGRVTVISSGSRLRLEELKLVDRMGEDGVDDMAA